MQNRIIPLLLLMVLTGCVHYQPRPIDPAKTAAEWQSRSLDTEELHTFLIKHLANPPAEWPLKTWHLDELTLAAFYYNPGLEVARSQWRGSRAAEITATQRPNPTLTLSPGYDFTATSLGANPWLPGATLDVPIETMGKRGYRRAQAALGSESSRLALMQSAWAVRSAVRSNVVAQSTWKIKFQFLQQQQQKQSSIMYFLQQREKAGAASSTELTLVQVAFNKITSDLVDARQQVQDATFNLAEAIGVPVAAVEHLGVEYGSEELESDFKKLSLETLRDIGLKNRVDVLGALADYSASEFALRLQIAKQYPDVHLAPNYQYNQGDHQFLLGIGAELPLLNQNQGPIAEAKAKRAELASKFYEVQSRAISEIERCYQTYSNAWDGMKASGAMFETQRKLAASVDAQLKNGAADKLDLLNSEIDMLSTQMLMTEARFKVMNAMGGLEDALQRPVEIFKPIVIETATHPPEREN